MSLGVLLRDGNHGGTEKSAVTRFALLADRVSITVARTPIQVPIPQQRPMLIDIGSVRPNISISGTIDAVGLNQTEDATSYYMDSLTYKLYNTPTTDLVSTRTYYIPYKNVLEDFLYYVLYNEDSTPLQLEILGPKAPPPEAKAGKRYHTIPTGEFHTGGAIYNVAIQNVSFNMEATKEDRYAFSMALVATTRLDQKKRADGLNPKYAPSGYDIGFLQGKAINEQGDLGYTGPPGLVDDGGAP